MTQGIRLELGSGTKARFWWDRWLEDGILKDLYPRLYSLSNQKDCCIRECGFWDGIQSNFQWKRNLFQWELEVLDEMHQALAGMHLKRNTNDRVIWKFGKEGQFSVISITKVLMEKKVQSVGYNAFNFTKSIWKDLVPPK